MFGWHATPMPIPSATARMKRFRLLNLTCPRMANPEIITLEKRKMTMPPSTQVGIEVITPENLPNTPKTMSQNAQANPAAREAQRVITMTPLFWEKVVLGGHVMRAAMKEFSPSASRPPWMRDSASGPCDGMFEASHEAPTSPIDSTVDTTKPIRMGSRPSGEKPIGNVVAQLKVMVSASSILALVTKFFPFTSMPMEMKYTRKSERMTLQFLMKGEPNVRKMIMTMITRVPIPT
mmetsp:Transcript_20047/g.50030  ORF Transcript_20047/g.50030 Transcript_20047/m.50030 type:complete len:235 (-) Transcript_20047:900-1604(-)